MLTLKISLAMIVKDGATYIERCIKSVRNLVDEIVIIDTGSTDNTKEIIEKYPDIILRNFEWNNDFSAARNFSIENTTGDYVLVLDSDEYIVSGSRDELEFITSKTSIGRIRICSNYKIKDEIYTSSAYISRFFPRNLRYAGIIHEQLVSDLPRTKMNISVNHDGYMETNKSIRNIPLLKEAIRLNPKDPYYLFQLGKELRISERFEESFYYLMMSYEIINKTAPYYEELILELINSGKECGKKELLEIIDQNEYKLMNVSDFQFAKGLFYLNHCITYPTEASIYIKKIEASFLNAISKNMGYKEYVQGTSSYLATYNLGLYYELFGDIEKAIYYFKLSKEYGYLPAKKRLENNYNKLLF